MYLVSLPLPPPPPLHGHCSFPLIAQKQIEVDVFPTVKLNSARSGRP